MKTESTTDGLDALLIILFGIPMSILLTFYQIFIIEKYVEWFKLPVTLTTAQWFGSLSVISLITYSMVKSEAKGFGDMVSKIIGTAIAYTLIMGISYVIHFMI